MAEGNKKQNKTIKKITSIGNSVFSKPWKKKCRQDQKKYRGQG